MFKINTVTEKIKIISLGFCTEELLLCLLHANERCCQLNYYKIYFFRSSFSPFNSSFIYFYFYSFCSNWDEMTNRSGSRDKNLSRENFGQMGTYGKRNNNNNNKSTINRNNRIAATPCSLGT